MFGTLSVTNQLAAASILLIRARGEGIGSELVDEDDELEHEEAIMLSEMWFFFLLAKFRKFVIM